MVSGYITLDEFKDSNYYCLFTKCCEDTRDEDMLINELITIATNQVVNYLGYDIALQNRKERFVGKDNNLYLTKHFPISGETTFFYRERNRPSCTGTITTFITDRDKGIIESDCYFDSSRRYEIEYVAGYDPIPEDIKTCVKHLIANLSQQIDTGNINNPNVGQSSGKVDQILSYSIGNNSGVLMNVLLKDPNDIKNLPQTVYPILNRYKKGRLS